ncbi:MAG: DCC1-like thiol-disulfide oxidoreductase family protein [Bacteroidota bacterium]
MEKSIIIFDGECNLCNGVVGWLLRNTDMDIFDYVPFQSSYGQEILGRNGFKTDTLETVVLLDENGIHTLSDGFLRIIAKIPEWSVLAITLGIVPRFIRDGVYRIAAKNRVRWFGKSQFCTVSLS